MKKNTLENLNDHLFAEMERLSDEDLKGEALEEELKRAKGITSVGTQIINNARTVLDTMKFMDDRNDIDKPIPLMLVGNPESKPQTKQLKGIKK